MKEANNIIFFIKEYFKNKEVEGLFLLSGGFSRKEISIVNNILVSDMETLFIYNKKNNIKKLQKLLKELEILLKNKFDFFPKSFEVEVENVNYEELITNKDILLVHQFETLKTNEVLFLKGFSTDILNDNFNVCKESIYDIFFHRILNQISLAFNFESKNLNRVFYNRTIKNLSDFITYSYLLNETFDKPWIVKKQDRVDHLIQTNNVLNDVKKVFKLDGIRESDEKVFFNIWKRVMLNWSKDYLKKSNNGEKTLSIKKSKLSKIYSIIVLSIFNLIYNKKINQKKIIGIFKSSLFESDSMENFNKLLIESLKPYGYSEKKYPYLNGIFFIYWIKDIKYYKSLK